VGILTIATMFHCSPVLFGWSHYVHRPGSVRNGRPESARPVRHPACYAALPFEPPKYVAGPPTPQALAAGRSVTTFSLDGEIYFGLGLGTAAFVLVG